MDAVLFDLFGTLIPNVPRSVWTDATDDIAALLGGEPEPLRAEMSAQFPLRMNGEIPDGPNQFERLATNLAITAEPEALAAAAERWQAMLIEGFHPKPEAIGVLDALQARGIKLGLVTDCSTGTRTLFEQSPMGPYFEACAYSAHLRTTKPDARMYRHVIERLSVRPERCLYVGDGNSHELRGARELGMRTVWVDNGEAQHVRSRFDSDADHTVTTLDGVLALDGVGPLLA